MKPFDTTLLRGILTGKVTTWNTGNTERDSKRRKRDTGVE